MIDPYWNILKVDQMNYSNNFETEVLNGASFSCLSAKITDSIIERKRKENETMILFTILALIIVLLIVFMITVVSVGGAVGTILFSDVIVCIALIALAIKFLFFRKK